MAVALNNQNQWYTIASGGPYTTTVSGSSATWTNRIQARWTSLSGTTYSVQYRCVIDKSSGSLSTVTSSYNAWSIGGTGANTSSASGGTISLSSTGINQVGSTSGSVNGTSGSVSGGVRLGYYGTTWGSTGLSGSYTLPSPGTPPSNGYVNNLQAKYNPENKLIEFSAENAGVSSSLALTSLEFSILKVPHTTSGLPRQSISFTNDSSVMLNQENSTAQNGGVTIQSNDLYYVGIYAANSAGSYRYNGPSIVSPCEPADITLVRASDTSVSVYYAIDADGGYYTRKIEYSLDGGNNWATGDTIPNGSISGVFTVTNLDSYRTYTISFRVRTDAGSTSCGSVNFALLKPKFYGPVNGLTEKTNAFYGSLNNQTKKIIKYYASENGRAKLIYKENS